MIDNREHVQFEDLNDYLDGRLDNKTTSRIAEHLSLCSDCRSEHDQLSNLLVVASTAKVPVDPAEDLWGEVKRTIDSRKQVALPVAVDAPGRSVRRKRVQLSPAFLAAAAVVLIVVSSGITTVVLRNSQRDVAEVPRSMNTPSLVLPAAFVATEDEYTRTIGELRIAVDAQRENLSPETVRTVDRSLAVVDSAIAEARAALLADPSNRTLVDLLASSYQRKVDLLRRTSELSPKI